MEMFPLTVSVSNWNIATVSCHHAEKPELRLTPCTLPVGRVSKENALIMGGGKATAASYVHSGGEGNIRVPVI